MLARPPQSLLLLTIAAFGGACGGSTVTSDQAYADQLIARELQPRMTVGEVRTFLARHASNAVLHDGCGLRAHLQPNCAYSIVAVLPLPGHNWWLGQGDLQIFMVFDTQQRLLSLDYELTYPEGPEQS